MGKEKLVGWFMIAAAALLVFFMLSRREGFDSSDFSDSSAKDASVITRRRPWRTGPRSGQEADSVPS